MKYKYLFIFIIISVFFFGHTSDVKAAVLPIGGCQSDRPVWTPPSLVPWKNASNSNSQYFHLDQNYTEPGLQPIPITADCDADPNSRCDGWCFSEPSYQDFSPCPSTDVRMGWCQSPVNRVDTHPPTCGVPGGSGPTFTFPSSDTGNPLPSGDSGLDATNNYTCTATAGNFCSIVIKDRAGNQTTCTSPTPAACTVSISFSPSTGTTGSPNSTTEYCSGNNTTNVTYSCSGAWTGSGSLASPSGCSSTYLGKTFASREDCTLSADSATGGASCSSSTTFTPLKINGGWSAWSAPSTQCGYTGTQTRTCTNPTPANEGADCSLLDGGNSSKTYTNASCPINGGWSAWSPASCPTACGQPASTLNRTCTNPAPSNGGKLCTDSTNPNDNGTNASQSCSATAACVGPVNGSCSATHYGCSAGTNPAGSSTGGTNVSGASNWTWNCNGSGTGHTDANCSENKSLPTVTTTTPVTNITTTTATGGGTIVSNGGATVTVSGIAWSTTANPTYTPGNTTTQRTDGWASGGPWVSANMGASPTTPLTSNTPYHYRAYAVNSVGTAYGADVTFTTSGGGAVPVVTISVSSTPPSGTTGTAGVINPTIIWSSTNSPTFPCTATGPAGFTWATVGDKPVSSAGVAQGVLNTAGTYTYTLTCSNANGSGSNSVTVTVTGGASCNNDGFQNNGETGIDCGGGNCSACGGPAPACGQCNVGIGTLHKGSHPAGSNTGCVVGNPSVPVSTTRTWTWNCNYTSCFEIKIVPGFIEN